MFLRRRGRLWMFEVEMVVIVVRLFLALRRGIYIYS